MGGGPLLVLFSATAAIVGFVPGLGLVWWRLARVVGARRVSRIFARVIWAQLVSGVLVGIVGPMLIAGAGLVTSYLLRDFGGQLPLVSGALLGGWVVAGAPSRVSLLALAMIPVWYLIGFRVAVCSEGRMVRSVVQGAEGKSLGQALRERYLMQAIVSMFIWHEWLLG